MGKNKSHKARKNKEKLSHPCGCFYCCGNPAKEHLVRKLKYVKNENLKFLTDE